MSSTQEQALDFITDLAVCNDNLRIILNAASSKALATLCETPYIWYNMSIGLRSKTRKALVVLNDTKISYLIRRFVSERDGKAIDCLLSELTSYLRWVLVASISSTKP